MASGGGSASRRTMSEPRSRALCSRRDSEDVSSLGSAKYDDRPNNWDFSDWQPNSTYESKRMKKGNPEREKEKEREKERERGRENVTLSRESSPSTDKGRQHTPSTFPRTKMTSVTPLAQRVALENLRQHMTFSDADELSTDGERNNERFLQRKSRMANHPFPETSRDQLLGVAATEGSNMNEKPDSNQIVGRLMQIRDYIKQATTMMGNLQKSTDSRCLEQHDKLEDLVRHLEEQETTYLGLLETSLAARESGSFGCQNSQESGNNSRPESESEIDVESDTGTEATTENMGEDNLRPCIEDKLGRHSDTEAEMVTPRGSLDDDRTMPTTRVAQTDTTCTLLESDFAKKKKVPTATLR